MISPVYFMPRKSYTLVNTSFHFGVAAWGRVAALEEPRPMGASVYTSRLCVHSMCPFVLKHERVLFIFILQERTTSFLKGKS